MMFLSHKRLILSQAFDAVAVVLCVPVIYQLMRLFILFYSPAAGSDVILRRKPSADDKYAQESQQTLKFQCLQAKRLKIAF